jgi:hypothetical protein
MEPKEELKLERSRLKILEKIDVLKAKFPAADEYMKQLQKLHDKGGDEAVPWRKLADAERVVETLCKDTVGYLNNLLKLLSRFSCTCV